MIFVTVGTQEPFDRLVGTVDSWAERHPGAEVFAQIGDGARVPRAIHWVARLDPVEFHERLAKARVVVSHAGMGTILSALSLNKRILVMPRLARYHEHRSDHQVATVRRMLQLGLVSVAQDEGELASRLDRLGELETPCGIRPHASEELLARIRSFLRSEA